MASVTFSPAGSQLDSDPIADIQLDIGDFMTVSFALDTSNLNADLQFLKLQLFQDSAEVALSDTPTNFFVTTFPDATFSEINSDGDLFSAVVELRSESGAVPDMVNIIIESEVTALNGLVNDGTADIEVKVLEAIDSLGNDVTDLFEPINQAIDIQPFPVVSIEVEPTFVIEGKGSQTVTFNLTEPAPPEGLVVDVLITDSDTQADTIPDLEKAQNVVDPQIIVENNRIVARFTIVEGATEGSIDFTAVEDDLVEGNERFSLTLLPQDSYNIDPDNNIITSVVTDADIVIERTSLDNLLNGAETADAILGKAGDDVIFGNGGKDALFGGRGNDLIVGLTANDFLDGGGGRDRLIADAGDDLLLGGNGQDRLSGGEGEDTLYGGNGLDTLIGGEGSDLLVGGKGRDRLIGVDISSNKPGFKEQDILIGGSNKDTFVLGNEVGIFYDDGDNFTSGDADYATVRDLNTQKDTIQLFGFAEQYSLDFLLDSQGNIDAKLIYDSGIDSGAELIALLENVATDLSIDDSVFTFV